MESAFSPALNCVLVLLISFPFPISISSTSQFDHLAIVNFRNTATLRFSDRQHTPLWPRHLALRPPFLCPTPDIRFHSSDLAFGNLLHPSARSLASQLSKPATATSTLRNTTRTNPKWAKPSVNPRSPVPRSSSLQRSFHRDKTSIPRTSKSKKASRSWIARVDT